VVLGVSRVSRGVRHHREHTQLIGTPARSSGILKVYSNLTSSAGMSFAESSGGSSMGRSRTRTSSANSTDSHGNGHIDMTFDDDTHHYDKSQECPSDILLEDVSGHKDIAELLQKIRGDE